MNDTIDPPAGLIDRLTRIANLNPPPSSLYRRRAVLRRRMNQLRSEAMDVWNQLDAIEKELEARHAG